MFDVGFSELVLIFLVGLLVFGPNQLPRLARDVSLFIRKVKIVTGSAKAEIEREFQIIEMRDSLRAERHRVEKELNALTPVHPAQWLPRPPALAASDRPPDLVDPKDETGFKSGNDVR